MNDNKKLSFKTAPTDGVSLSVYNVGYEKCKPLHKWGNGVRDHYLIHHIISGKGVYKTPHGEFALEAGDTFLVYPNTEISYIADENEPWEYYWVGFSGTDAQPIIEHTDFSSEYPIILTNFGNDLKERLSEIYLCRGRDNSSLIKMTGQLYIMLSLIMEKSSVELSTENYAKHYVKTAKKYIAYNYSLAISVEDVAAFVGVSRSTLFRAFTEISGVSPIEYLTSFRVKQAARLLRNTDLAISAVSTSVGYEDSLYFSKVFKKVKSISPSQYRANFISQKS